MAYDPRDLPKISPTEIVHKVWGHEEVIVNRPEYCGKILYITPGFRSSKHYHKEKRETFYVMAGEVHLEMKDRCTLLRAGESMTIEPYTPHSFWVSRGEQTATVIEFSTHHSDEDVVRLSHSRALAADFRPTYTEE